MFGDNSLNQNQQRLTEEENQLIGRREGMTINIRKQGRQNQIIKRRRQNILVANTLKVVEDQTELSPLQIKIKQIKKIVFNVNQIPQLKQYMHSTEIEKIYYGIIGIRKLLSAAQQPPIQLVIDADLLPRIIQLAKQTQEEGLKAQATWCLSNVAAGTSLQTQFMINIGGIQLFVDLLKYTNDIVVQQSLWALGNLAADRVSYRDSLLKYDVLNILCKLIEQSHNTIIIGQGCWVISNIIRTNPIPSFEKLKPSINAMAKMLIQSKVTDCSVITDTLWAFSYVTALDQVKLAFFVETGIIQKLIKLLDCGINQIISASVRNIGNICYGNEQEIQTLFQYNILAQFQKILQSNSKDIRKQVCWTISNIAASSSKNTKIVLSYPKLLSQILNFIQEQKRTQIIIQSGYIFVNISQYGDVQTLVPYYHNNNIVQLYIKLLGSTSNDVVEMALKGINGCLKIGQQFKSQTNGVSVIMEDLERANGIEALQKAQLHQSTKIYKLSNKILNSYFDLENPLQ